MLDVPQHEMVNHSVGEYVRGNAHMNTIESVWALLKRQIVGTHHWVSQKHLQHVCFRNVVANEPPRHDGRTAG